MTRQRARTLARHCIMTGLAPSEVRAMTPLEITAYAEVLFEVRGG